MTDFDADDPMVQHLLAAGRDDLPSEQTVERAFVAVAAAAASVGITTSAVAAHAAGAGVSAIGKNAGAALGWLAFAKWTGIGLSAGLVTLGAVDGASRLASNEPMPAVAVASQKNESRPAIAPRFVPAIGERAEAAPANIEEPISAAVPRSGLDPLGLEVSRLDAARSALDRGDARAALSATRRYEAEYPNGRLLPEALVLRMRAFEKLGDSAGARGAAQRIIEISPSSPHAARARAVLETL